MILLAEHDEPSLAAKKKRQHVALETPTSPSKNRVWNFFDRALGRPGVDPDLSWENATGSVQYSYKNASGQGYYYTFDHLGSVREMTDGSGTIQARYDYDPYGRTTLVSGTNLSDFQYAGYYMHQTSGLYLTMFRAFDPNTGKWLSRDPLGERIGPNLYQYVGNNPVRYTDPLGLEGTGGDTVQETLAIARVEAETAQALGTATPAQLRLLAAAAALDAADAATTFGEGVEQAVTAAKNFPGTPQQKADFLENLLKQLAKKFSRPFQCTRTTTPGGGQTLTGVPGPNGAPTVWITPNGTVYSNF